MQPIPKSWRIVRPMVYRGIPGSLICVGGAGREIFVSLSGGILACQTLVFGWRSTHAESVTDLLGQRLAEITTETLRREQEPEDDV